MRRAPLFAALDDEAAAALDRHRCPTSHLERGDVLFHEGDQGDRLYVIAEGKIKLGRTCVDGRENLLAILGPGEMFGELSLFDPGPRTATATAVTETQLIGLGHESLHAFLAGRPAVASTLLRPSPGGCAAPTRRWPTWSSPTSPAASPRRCSTWPTGSAAPPRTASSSPTTSPRRSSPSSSAPPARRSTRRWPTSPPAAGCGSRPAPWSCSTSSASSAAPADRCPRTTRRGDATGSGWVRRYSSWARTLSRAAGQTSRGTSA